MNYIFGADLLSRILAERTNAIWKVDIQPNPTNALSSTVDAQNRQVIAKLTIKASEAKVATLIFNETTAILLVELILKSSNPKREMIIGKKLSLTESGILRWFIKDIVEAAFHGLHERPRINVDISIIAKDAIDGAFELHSNATASWLMEADSPYGSLAFLLIAPARPSQHAEAVFNYFSQSLSNTNESGSSSLQKSDLTDMDIRNLSYLQRMYRLHSRQVAMFLENQCPQVIAQLLRLTPEAVYASKILEYLPNGIAAKAISDLSDILDEAHWDITLECFRALIEAATIELSRKLQGYNSFSSENKAGPNFATEIIQGMSATSKKEVIEHLNRILPSLEN